MNITISCGERSYTDRNPVELVERKGVGHPDTICDAIAERISRYYSLYCHEHFGGIAHHWFDKVMLLGGEAHVAVGEGRMLRPYKVIVAGKGALAIEGKALPLLDISRRAASEVLSSVLRGFDPDRHLEVISEVVDHTGAGRLSGRYRPRRADLVTLGSRNGRSNDANLLSGFAPLSVLEQMVLFVERYLNGPIFRTANDDTGSDIKVIGVRTGSSLTIHVNLPFLASCIPSTETYWKRKAEIAGDVAAQLDSYFHHPVELIFNPQDHDGRPYLTAMGSVADTGDVGVVGRGNRINGLITPMRTMSIEAPAGKNPLDHTGKLYGIVAERLARSLHVEFGVPVEVFVSTVKERPLADPDQVALVFSSAERAPADTQRLASIVRDAFAATSAITEELVLKGLTLW